VNGWAGLRRRKSYLKSNSLGGKAEGRRCPAGNALGVLKVPRKNTLTTDKYPWAEKIKINSENTISWNLKQ
jgi:hypothetical protein